MSLKWTDRIHLRCRAGFVAPVEAIRAHTQGTYLATLQDLRTTPAYRLEALEGKRKGQYCIRINDQWRICFKWSQGNAAEVEITDYH